MNVLIDSDVLLDFFLKRLPFAFEARDVLKLCEKKVVTGFTTPVAIANLYYISRRNKLSHDMVLMNLKMLLNHLEVAVMDRNVVLDTLNSGWKDFEDAMQNFSAVRNQQIDTIITRNIKDYKNSKLPVMTPSSFLETTFNK